MEEALLRLDDVRVAFGALRAVDGVSLSVARGERRAIIGPNGAGKTTLFNAIAGEQRVTSGTVRLDGHDVTRLDTARRARRGLARTFQITTLFGGISVEDNLRLAVRGRSRRKLSFFGDGACTPEEADAVAARLAASGLEARRTTPVRELSHGEQRQLELQLALASRPSLLLLDEPAAGLSPAERVSMARIIEALPRTLTVVLIEHDMDLALGLVDRVTCLHYGQVLTEGDPAAIRANPQVQEVYLGKPRDA
ncbi:MAG TPA: ABC transporter ATP-binding protein [Usitatibacter sp.]|nr:ABC transporter ATP-binding protein [Usitatibacter sp.]